MNKTQTEKLFANTRKGRDGECWEWTASKFRAGYGALRADNGKTIYAHRLSYIIHVGEIPAGMFVCHRCDNRACVNPKHLFLGTQADNMADKVSKGRQRRGVTSPMAKLTESDVHAIRAAEGTQREIAKRFGIVQQQVSMIRSGKQWGHI